MNISELLTPNLTCCNAPGISKKRVLEFIATFAAEKTGVLDADALYHELIARERLGSTGLGGSIAIPHCRLEGCKSITGILLKLQSPVDFDASDGGEVDLVFALIVPNEQNDEHLQALAAVAALMQSAEARDALRSSTSDAQLYQIATAMP